MRIGSGEGRASAAGNGEPERPGGFAGALERAGRAARTGRCAEDPAGDPAPGGWTVDAMLAEVSSPGRAESTDRAAQAPLLARAVERIVLLVKAGEAPSVTLQLGPSLQVRIEQSRGGVEVQIRAPRGISSIAEAELPLLVAALRARGVRVARAGVGPHGGRRGRR
jgi:hypothetical protein